MFTITKNTYCKLRRIQILNAKIEYYDSILNSKYGKNDKNAIKRKAKIENEILTIAREIKFR